MPKLKYVNTAKFKKKHKPYDLVSKGKKVQITKCAIKK